MRKAAGILLIVFGVATIGALVFGARERGYPVDVYSYSLLIIITELLVLLVAGGVFCLKRKHWVLCLTSSILLHLSVVVLLPDFFPYYWRRSLPGWFAYLMPVTILPFIFIWLRKREWQEISDSVGREVSEDG